jgi:uncharacterized membrane protein (UPF0127 family)
MSMGIVENTFVIKNMMRELQMVFVGADSSLEDVIQN